MLNLAIPSDQENVYFQERDLRLIIACQMLIFYCVKSLVWVRDQHHMPGSHTGTDISVQLPKKVPKSKKKLGSVRFELSGSTWF